MRFLGGQRRTIEAPCGWRCVGHPQEVNKKWERHIRLCSNCKETQVKELPEHNSNSGQINGWNGIQQTKNGNVKLINKNISTVFLDGEEIEVTTERGSVTQAIDSIKFIASLNNI